MLPDILSIALKAASLIAALQATGGALFLLLFRHQLSATVQPVVRVVRIAALAGAAGLLAHAWLESARMAGAFSGLVDPVLLRLILQAPIMTGLAVQLLSLLLVLVSLRQRGTFQEVTSVLGVVFFAASFTLTGHTAIHPERALLATMLMLHLLIVNLWFGALLPLYFVSHHEQPDHFARIVGRFSRLAGGTVPLILVAGMVLLWRLLPGVDALWAPYGLLLLAKIGGFAFLMLLATLNKWRWGPRVGIEPGVRNAFRRSVLLEYALIAVVLAMTATMTTLFSPEG